MVIFLEDEEGMTKSARPVHVAAYHDLQLILEFAMNLYALYRRNYVWRKHELL
jgi:hypothetical protein